MWGKIFLLGAATMLVSGCMTAEERRAADEAKCRSYGFAKRNDAFAECMQRIDLDRSANTRATMYDYWGRPYYPYSRYYFASRPKAGQAAEKGR